MTLRSLSSFSVGAGLEIAHLGMGTVHGVVTVNVGTVSLEQFVCVNIRVVSLPARIMSTMFPELRTFRTRA